MSCSEQAFIKFEHAIGYTDTLTLQGVTTKDVVSLDTLYTNYFRKFIDKDKETYYMFFISKGVNTQSGIGYLVGNHKVTLLIGNTNYVTATHELGHNLGLQHTWEKDSDGARNVLNHGNRKLPPQFSTHNIMDYKYKHEPERCYFFKYQIDYLKNK